MLSAVSSVISGAGAVLGTGGGWSWQHDDHCTNVARLLYTVYRWGACTGVLYTASGPAPVPGTPRPGEHWHMSPPVVTSGHGPILPVSLDTVCSILQRRLCEPTRGPVSVLMSGRQRKVKSEYKLKHML